MLVRGLKVSDDAYICNGACPIIHLFLETNRFASSMKEDSCGCSED